MKKHISLFIAIAMLAASIPFIAAPQLEPVSAAGEFKKVDDGGALYYDAANCPAKGIYEASDAIVSAESSDENVFVANRGLPYTYYTDQNPEGDQSDLGNDGKCEILPMGEGTATLTLKNDEGKTITETVTVKKEYFDAFLKSKLMGDNGPGIIHFAIDPSGEEWEYIDNTVGYGENKFNIYSRYGTKVSVKFKGKTYSKTTQTSGLASFKITKKLYKLKTKGSFTITFGPASITKTFKVVSNSSLNAVYIKPGAGKGSLKVKQIHKGDYIKVKVGKKTVKTVKYKKAKKTATVKFYRYRMKKNTKVKAYMYNKYKQKLATMNYKVGEEVYDYE